MPRKGWDITPYINDVKDKIYIHKYSVRMTAKGLGIDHKVLSKAMKKAGLSVPTRNESARYTWKNHTHPQLGKTGDKSPSYGRKMTDENKKQLSEANSGEKNYHWSGGRKMHSGGYILVYSPNHPYADANGFVLEHRLIYENYLGRILEPDEIIHHINEDKTDNRIDNLILVTRAEHLNLHRKNYNYRKGE